MNELMEQIKKKDARSFTHGGKFHADDVFSAALLFYINPEITILRGNRVPDDFDGIVFDIGRGAYDHHQRDSRVRENGVPYAAFGLLWEAVGAEILGEELAEEFDEAFVQPLDHNDNTGEKNELATLIGNFNPTWDAQGGNDEAFFQAVSVAGMILENKFERYRGNERADRRVEEILEEHRQAVTSGKRDSEDAKILILPEFVPCQKRLSETEIAFVIFPSNRGGYCIQPQKKEYSMNYKCSFPAEWLGLENEELEQVTGLQSAGFCHKGGFLMTVGMLEDAVKACRISMELYHENPTIVNLGGDSCIDPLLKQLPGMQEATVIHMDFMQLPELTVDGIYGEAAMDKQQWKNEVKENLKRILKQKPEAVYVEGNVFETYPIVHQLRKKHIPVLTMMEKDGQRGAIFLKSNKYEIDMCNGSIMDKLVSFALPLMLSGILQLMFNAVDIIVVGRFSGSEALAAVGSTTALINVFTNLFIGISLGANVLAARFFAAGREEEMSETVHTSITLALISGILMAFVGLVFSKGALELMGTPEDVIGLSTLYMRIYFMGMPFFMLYNYGAAILRAVGDTKRPLYFLIIAGVINAGLNMVLVIVFGLGVAGVGIATVFSQMVSCVLVLTCLCRTEGSYKLSFSKLSMKGYYLKQIFQVGIPAGIQSTVINFSNALLQSSVNSFGSTAMAGYTAANNILGFLYVSINSVTQACMSFTSQNFGVGKYKRMDRVLMDCMILSVGAALVLGCGAYFFGAEILQIYTEEADVIQCGVEILSITTVPYFLCGIMDLFPGALRGMGYSAVPMVLSIIGTVGMRVLWIFAFFPQHRSLYFLFISYPASWIATIVMQVVCYYFVRKHCYK